MADRTTELLYILSVKDEASSEFQKAKRELLEMDAAAMGLNVTSAKTVRQQKEEKTALEQAAQAISKKKVELGAATAMYGKNSAEVAKTRGELLTLAPHIADTAGKFETLGTKATQAFRGFAASILNFSLLAGGLVVAGRMIGDFITNAIEAFRALQYEIAAIKTIKPEIDTSVLYAQLSELQTRVPKTSKELAQSYYQIASSIAASSEEILMLTEKTAQGAVAARVETETWSTAVVGAMNAYGKSVEDVDHIQDLFFETIRDGVVNGRQLAAGFGPIAQSARLAGVSLEEAAASTAMVTKQGGDAAQNLNDLNNYFQKFSTKEAQDGMVNLGVRTVDTNGNFLDQIDILTQLESRLSGLTESGKAAAVQSIFGDIQAQRGLEKLLNDIPALTRLINEYKTSTGEAGAAFATMMDTDQAKLEQFNGYVKQFQEENGKNWTDFFSFLDFGLQGAKQKAVLQQMANDNKITFDQMEQIWAQFGGSFGDIGIPEAKAAIADFQKANQDAAIEVERAHRVAAAHARDDLGSIGKAIDDLPTEKTINIHIVTTRTGPAVGASPEGGLDSDVVQKHGPTDVFQQASNQQQQAAQDRARAEGTDWYSELMKKRAAAAKSAASEAEAAARKMDQAADAQRLAQQEMNVFHAKELVARAQDDLNKVTDEYAKKIDDATEAENRLEKEEKARLDEIAPGMKQAEDAATDFSEKSRRGVEELDEQLYELGQTLQDIEDAGAMMLKPLMDDVDRAKDKLDELRNATEQGDAAFDEQSHNLDQNMRPLQDALQAQNAALQAARDHVTAVGEAWDEILLPAQTRATELQKALTDAQRELNAVQHEQDVDDRSKRLHDQALEIDNLTIRILNASGAQRKELELQKALAQAKLARDTKIGGLEDKVTDLNNQKEAQDEVVAGIEVQKAAALKLAEAQVKAAEDQVKATQAQIDILQEQQKLLDRARQDFDYDQHQKEVAAQKELDQANAALDKKKEEIDAIEANTKAQIESVERVRAAKVHDDKLEQDRLDAIATGYENEYNRIKAVYDAQEQAVLTQIENLKEEEKQATKPLKAIVDFFTANANTLQAAYQGIEQIDRAIDAGAKLTPELQTALQNFKTQALDIVKAQVDPSNPTSLASLWAIAWSADDPRGFRKLHNTSLDEMNKGVILWSGSEVEKVKAVTAAYQDLIDTMAKLPGTSPSAPPRDSRPPGGTTSGTINFPGGFGTSTMSPTYGGQGMGGYGGGPSVVNISPIISFAGAPVATKDQIDYTVRRAIFESMEEHAKQTGRQFVVVVKG